MNQPRPSAFRSFATVLGGTTMAQLLGFLVLPVLTRHFAPEAFGAFQVYLAILTFLTVGVGLRIELSLLRVPNAELLPTIHSLNLVMTLVALVETGILELLSSFEMVPGIGKLPFPAWMLALPLFANGMAQGYTYYVTRTQRFGRIVMLRLVQVFGYIGVGLTLAFTIKPSSGIILADAAGRVASLAAVTVFLAREGIPPVAFRNLGQLPAFLNRHRELALVSLPGAVANNFGAIITPVMLFATYGAATTGQYSVLDRSANVPLAMIVTAASQVYVGQLAYHLREETGLAGRLFKRTAIGCLALGIVGALVLWPFLPWLFRSVYGPGWEQAAAFSRIMIFAYALLFAAGVTNQTLVSMRAFRRQACWDVLWPLCFGVAWAVLSSRHAPVYDAIVVHASILSGLSIVFLILCAVAIRSAGRAGGARGDQA
jgi:teichuronic acid exporter